MKKLPVTKNDYDKSVIISGFLALFKSKAEADEHISDLLFKPQLDGYIISFLYDEKPSYILLSFGKSLFGARVKVNCRLGEKKEQSFTSKGEATNRQIINEILKQP